MYISKRLFVLLMVLASAGVGATMYVALLATGSQGDATAPVSTAPSEIPVKVTLDADDLGLEACIPTGEGGLGGEGISDGGGESGDFATNSGTIAGSQFNDGGFGDIGQQWWNVNVAGNVTTVNVTDSGTANVNVGTSTTPPDSIATAVPSSTPSSAGTGSTAGSTSAPIAAPDSTAPTSTEPAAAG